MRAVFVNHCHPEMPHVCAMRLREFAAALATRGHAVVLLTETLNRTDPAPPPERVREDLARHDWSRPFWLACPPRPAPLLERLRAGRLPGGLRKAVIGFQYLFRDGMFSDWTAGALPTLGPLAETFRPDVTWGTFGNTDAWNIARKLAKRAGCPWVADLKDNWSAFMPPGLRRRMAGRYRDAAHMTVFSEGHRAEAERWFPQEKTVLYSGFPKPFLDQPAPAENGIFRVTVTGSLYDAGGIESVLDAFAGWIAKRGLDPAQVELAYAGGGTTHMERAAQMLEGRCRTALTGFLPLGDLRALQAASALNLYIRSPQVPFHHKLPELLSAGRPVASFPGESDEARAIAADAGAAFFPCENAADLERAFDTAHSGAAPAPDRGRLAAYTWEEQARVLERVLQEAAS